MIPDMHIKDQREGCIEYTRSKVGGGPEGCSGVCGAN